MSVATHVLGVARIRRRGEGRFELRIDRGFATAEVIADAVRGGRALHVEVLLPDGSSVIVPGRPRIDRGSVCVSLPARLNHVWEGLWLGGKPVPIRVAVALG